MYKFLIAGALLITFSGCSIISSGFSYESRPYSGEPVSQYYTGHQQHSYTPSNTKPAPSAKTPENLHVPRPAPTAPNLQVPPSPQDSEHPASNGKHEHEDDDSETESDD